MNSRKIVRILFKKEIKDIFRDRKSVLMMFFVPVVLYPLIFFVAFFVLSLIQTGVGTQTYNVVISGNDNKVLESELLNQDTTASTDSLSSSTDISTKALSTNNYIITILDDNDLDSIIKHSKLEYTDKNDMIKKALDESLIDAYVTTDNSGDKYEVNYNSSVTNSVNSYNLIEDALLNIRLDKTKNTLKQNGLDPKSVLNPISIETVDTATSEESLGYFLSTIIPFMMVISLLISVFTPAIDATTGEKERGTLETLLMMPVTNTQIIVAKFFAVALIGIISTILSILSMSFLGVYMITAISESTNASLGGLDVSTFLPAIIIAIPVLIVLSLFLTAISMCVSCMAKTYKEANTYMSPVMIVVMLVGYIGFVPNIELDTTMSIIPVANVCLLIKNLLLFKVNIYTVFVVIISLAAFTGLILLVLGKLYKSEAILFDEGHGHLALLDRRSNMKKGGVPSTGDAWFVAIINILLLLYAGSLLQMKYGRAGIVYSQLLLLLIPALMTLYTKKNIRKTYSFFPPGSTHTKGASGCGAIRAVSGALIIGIGGILLGMSLAGFMMKLIPDEGQQVTTSIGSLLDGNPLLVWLVIAVTPAICEELIFRGYILSAFRERYSTLVTMILVGITFGVFHTSVVRFPTTAVFGMTLAYICIKTGSIYTGMFLHMLNNSIAVVSYFWPKWFEKYIPFLADDDLSVTTSVVLLFVALVCYGVGYVLINKKKKLPEEKCPDN